MGDMGEIFKEHRDYMRERKEREGIDCPGCKEQRPKANPTRLLPGWTCKVCGYNYVLPITEQSVKSLLCDSQAHGMGMSLIKHHNQEVPPVTLKATETERHLNEALKAFDGIRQAPPDCIGMKVAWLDNLTAGASLIQHLAAVAHVEHVAAENDRRRQ
jgi:hypothetical protein